MGTRSGGAAGRYRDRYFAEALPVLDGRDIRQMRRLARALYPVTLAEPATLAATSAAAQVDGQVGKNATS